MDIYQSLIFKN